MKQLIKEYFSYRNKINIVSSLYNVPKFEVLSAAKNVSKEFNTKKEFVLNTMIKSMEEINMNGWEEMNRINEQPNLTLEIIEGYRRGKEEILGKYISFSEACAMYLSDQLAEDVEE